MSLRFPVMPMKATLGTLPSGPGWAHEVKWDGYRTIAHVDGHATRWQSATGRDVSSERPELAGFAEAVNAGRAILDGELVALDVDGVPRFELMQQRGPDRPPATFHVFDVLRIDDHDTIDLPYEHRRQLLVSLVEADARWLVPPHQVGDGADLIAATAAHGLEGVVSKRLGSAYRPGTRSRDWVKVKHRRRVELVVGGVTRGSGARASSFGALLVGRRDGGFLRFAGAVGTGFTQTALDELTEQFRSLAIDECPFTPEPPASYRRDARWALPVVSVTVEIAEFTNDGLVRHASFVGLA